MCLNLSRLLLGTRFDSDVNSICTGHTHMSKSITPVKQPGVQFNKHVVLFETPHHHKLFHLTTALPLFQALLTGTIVFAVSK